MNCKFDHIAIKNCAIAKLALYECMGGGVSLENLDICNYTVIKKCKLKYAYFSFGSSQQISLVSNIGFPININNVRSQELVIGGQDQGMEYHINGRSAIDDIISSLSIKSGLAGSNEILVHNKYIHSIEMGDGFGSGRMSFSNCTLNSVTIDRFVNTGTLSVIKCNFSTDAVINLTDSNLGKAFIFGLDLNQAKDFSIHRSNLTEITYAEVKWCKKIPNYTKYPMSSAQLRETYKQLKNVTAKHNDKPEELRFHTLEMRAYKQEMKTSNRRWNDKIILMFNELTNDHGQSWVRPFFAVLLIILGSYFPIKYLLGFNSYAPEKFLTAISEMMECFNPVRKFSDSFGQIIPPADNWKTALAKILDILFLRVIVGLLLFQMVKAFRKYVK